MDVRWHSVRAAVQRVSSAAVYWVRTGSDIAGDGAVDVRGQSNHEQTRIT